MTPTDIRKINRRITAAFHCFEEIQKYSDQLLCTGEIDNIEEARDVYDKFERQVPLDWPLCESSGIMLVSLTYVKNIFKKIYHAKNKNKILLINSFKFLKNNTQKDLISLRLRFVEINCW